MAIKITWVGGIQVHEDSFSSRFDLDNNGNMKVPESHGQDIPEEEADDLCQENLHYRVFRVPISGNLWFTS